MLKSISHSKNKTYVGYSIDYKKRLIKHNSGKGAKATRGYKWKLIFKKLFKSKSMALKFEYKLKKNRKKRLSILQQYYEQRP
tara:strand:+ start:68 stop:313 length:246 start_codon:yes stop_codon:yes gene_type:complete